ERVREPGAGAKDRQVGVGQPAGEAQRRAARPHRRGAGNHPPDVVDVASGRFAVPRSEAVSGDRHVAGSRPATAAAR
nr:hypothetical protein [Tanacetum cinerariifolium]